MEILAADPAEATALRDLHVVTWEQAYRDHVSEPWYRERLAAHAVRDWAEIVRSEAARRGGVLNIHRLYVHPSRQGTGIGRSLLTASVDRLREGGAHTATLWVLETDHRAQAFYERLGWRPDGAGKTHPPTDLRYRLALDTA